MTAGHSFSYINFKSGTRFKRVISTEYKYIYATLVFNDRNVVMNFL